MSCQKKLEKEVYNIKYLVLQPTYTALTPVRLPEFSGLMIRGILGEKLKIISCHYRKNPLKAKCSKCAYLRDCPYGYTFEYKKDPFRPVAAFVPIPRPYVINNTPSGSIDVGETVSFSLKLFSTKHLTFIIKALESIDKIGRDRKRGFGSIKLKDIEIKEQEFSRLNHIGGRIRVAFKTPTIIFKQNLLQKRPSLYVIMSNIFRKYFLVANTYYRIIKTMKKEFSAVWKLKEASKIYLERVKLHEINRWSEKRKRRETINAIKGSITYSLNTAELTKEDKRSLRELIGFANVYGIGKLNSAGFGQAKITSY